MADRDYLFVREGELYNAYMPQGRPQAPPENRPPPAGAEELVRFSERFHSVCPDPPRRAVLPFRTARDIAQTALEGLGRDSIRTLGIVAHCNYLEGQGFVMQIGVGGGLMYLTEKNIPIFLNDLRPLRSRMASNGVIEFDGCLAGNFRRLLHDTSIFFYPVSVKGGYSYQLAPMSGLGKFLGNVVVCRCGVFSEQLGDLNYGQMINEWRQLAARYPGLGLPAGPVVETGAAEFVRAQYISAPRRHNVAPDPGAKKREPGR